MRHIPSDSCSLPRPNSGLLPSGVECRTVDGFARVVVVDIHSIDLVGLDIPWHALSKLSVLQELSLWDADVSGPIDPAVCLLLDLRVLALSDNQLRDRIPDCLRSLNLEWLWLDSNRLRGGLSRFSPLGEYLDNLENKNLDSNRWSPLMPAEKHLLEEMAESLGIPSRPHDWTFDYKYEFDALEFDGQLSAHAARETSYRVWSAGVPVTGLTVALPFEFPMRHSIFAREIGIGREADFVIGNGFRWSNQNADSQSDWFAVLTTGSSYMGCYVNGDQGDSPDTVAWDNYNYEMPEPSVAACRSHCTSAGYQYMGLEWVDRCLCGNIYFGAGMDTGCGDGGSNLPGPVFGSIPIFSTNMWSLAETGEDREHSSQRACWTQLLPLLPHPHTIDTLDTAVSAQGASYFRQRFCSDWSKSVAPSSAIFDGGDDMYDIGNFLATSLMGTCAEDLHDCALGSLTYRDDFEPAATGCFGPGGSYRMARLGAAWVFLAHNAFENPLDFFVLGNLGSDGSGAVTEFVLEADPFVGFVKRECGGSDPSVNHLIVVDSSGGLPTHSCNYETGGACTGASSDLDDDIVSGIPPGRW